MNPGVGQGFRSLQHFQQRQQHLLFPHPWKPPPSLNTLSTQVIAIEADLPDALIHLQGLCYGLKLSTGKTPQIHKKMDRISKNVVGMNLAMRFHLGESSQSSVTQLTPNKYRNGHCSLGMDENFDHLAPHDKAFQMITLCPLYIHALMYFEDLIISHLLKNIPVACFVFSCLGSIDLDLIPL